ncbi:hypothetical protein PanWU01x14_065180 [Parasponia andersonii]|uniref:F-box domain containing protein n=1 Tax=Parasponia andersonii TaxID=3476 RepID=A0A2P5DGU1_PARAD|nr:hypothetical protein PanWU01x14_065180 [Parasponia andersonii]
MGKTEKIAVSGTAKALSDDLLLELFLRFPHQRYLIHCSRVFSRTQYGIYNPLTRQLLWLPDAPNDGRNSFFHEFSNLYDPKCGFVYEVKNDETGKWRELSYPPGSARVVHYFDDFVARNGILFSLVGVGDVGIVAFYPSVDSTSEEDDRKICHLISMAINFVAG